MGLLGTGNGVNRTFTAATAKAVGARAGSTMSGHLARMAKKGANRRRRVVKPRHSPPRRPTNASPVVLGTKFGIY